MSANSKIEWTDHTFNPWIGCTKVSPACDHCYAERSTPARTLAVKWGPKAERRRTGSDNWALPKRWNAQADAFMAQHGRRQRVFCASLADVLDNEVPDDWRMALCDLIDATPNLDWLLLTKRIGNAPRMLPTRWLAEPRVHVWLGATICNQEEADRDIPKLLQVPARVRFLSIEPLLEPTYIEDIADPAGGVCLKPLAGLRWVGDGQGRCAVRALGARIDWVIAGGESGPGARPSHPDWFRSLRNQCQAAGVPFLFKQWGEWEPVQYVDQSTGRPLLKMAFSKTETTIGGPAEATEPVNMRRVGKKAAGRLLDGREWNEVPA